MLPLSTIAIAVSTRSLNMDRSEENIVLLLLGYSIPSGGVMPEKRGKNVIPFRNKFDIKRYCETRGPTAARSSTPNFATTLKAIFGGLIGICYKKSTKNREDACLISRR